MLTCAVKLFFAIMLNLFASSCSSVPIEQIEYHIVFRNQVDQS